MRRSVLKRVQRSIASSSRLPEKEATHLLSLPMSLAMTWPSYFSALHGESLTDKELVEVIQLVPVPDVGELVISQRRILPSVPSHKFGATTNLGRAVWTTQGLLFAYALLVRRHSQLFFLDKQLLLFSVLLIELPRPSLLSTQLILIREGCRPIWCRELDRLPELE